MSPLRNSLFLSSFLGLAPFTGAQTVHVVDDDGGAGVHFTQISDAVAAASSGDLILVRSGEYEGFGVDAKDLTIVEDTGHEALLSSTVFVNHLAADQTVELIGLGSANDGLGLGLSLSFNFGTVELDRLQADATFGAALTITDCSNVIVSQCELSSDSLDGPTMKSNASAVVVYGTSIQGSKGFGWPLLRDGGDAVEITSGLAFFAGCTLTGGKGANGSDLGPIGCFKGTGGGDGVQMGGFNPSLTLRDTTVTAGAGGSNAGCGGGADGTDIANPVGTVTDLPGPSRGYDVPQVARAGELAPVSFSGEAGELVLWLLSAGTAPYFETLTAGYVIPSTPGLINFGTLPESGTLEISFTIPDLPIDHLELYEQAVYLTSAGWIASEPRVSVLLDDAF